MPSPQKFGLKAFMRWEWARILPEKLRGAAENFRNRLTLYQMHKKATCHSGSVVYSFRLIFFNELIFYDFLFGYKVLSSCIKFHSFGSIKETYFN